MVGLPFLKRKKPEIMLGKGYVPTDRIRELASRGFSEPEMIDVLRKEGFSAEEIDKALTQALRVGVTGEAKPTEGPKLPKLEEIAPKSEKPPETPEIPETSLPSETYAPTYSTEDYVDYVIESRLSGVNEKMNEFNIKYQELTKRIGQMGGQLTEMSKTKASERQVLLNRIDSLKELIGDSNIRLGALEKAFKETLPALIESVRALSDLVQRFKREA